MGCISRGYATKIVYIKRPRAPRSMQLFGMDSAPSSIVFPPLDGSLSLPDIVDFNLQHNPSQPAFVFSPGGQPDTITHISHLEFGRAIHRAAHIIRPKGASDGRDGLVVAVIALLDPFVYQALVLGIMRAGFVPYPISSRNSPAAIAHMLRATSCHHIFATLGTLGGLTKEIQSHISQEIPDFVIHMGVAPTIGQLFPNLGQENVKHHFSLYPPLHKHFQPTDICMYLHSSGSTGFPKSISHSVRSIVEWAAIHLPNARIHIPRLRVGAMGLPPFHSTGFAVQVLYPVCGLLSLSVFPPAIWSPTDQPHPPTAEGILRQLRQTRANGVLLIPMILEEIAKSLDNIDYLRSFEFVAYGGGPMPRNLGDSLVASKINLQPGYGSTEAGPLTVIQFNRDRNLHWEWLEFSEKLNMRWVSQDDGTFEAQCLTSDIYHPSAENLEDTNGYATSDLFVPHPTLERFWRIVGRMDDVIIHSSGEKTVPAPMEGMMATNTIIQGVVMFGRGRDQTGVLLEPVRELSIDVRDTKQVAEFRNKAWPIVEEANKNAPAFSKIYKEMILITSPNKPLPRSAKGTVMRKVALELYDEEIEALYQTVELNTASDRILPPNSWDKDALQAWLLQQATDILSVKHLDSSRDLFEQGFDSLSATFLRLRIAGALRQLQHWSNSVQLQNIAYVHPVIEELAGYLARLASNSENVKADRSPTEAIEDMVAKYSVGLEKPFRRSFLSGELPVVHVVLITGSTGNLGSHILEQLLRRKDVGRVYAFNRHSGTSPLLSRMETRFKDNGIDTSLLYLPKLTLLEGNLDKENFGLLIEVFTQMQNLVTLVIHTAWRLDFNLTLASFESSIRGTRKLIDFARAGPHSSSVRFLYTSSVASAQSWGLDHGPYPEDVVYDTGRAVGNGYGESKYVSERILVESGLHATSIRIGQISGGPPNGAWATSDWVPILVKSSLAIGALPDAPGTISWLPMNATAQSILDMAFCSESPPTAINLIHPKPISWTVMFSHIQEVLLKGGYIMQDSLPFIPFHEWLSSLEKQAITTDQDKLHNIPAVKLVDFFRKIPLGNSNLPANGARSQESGGYGFPTFTTDKALYFSPTLRNLNELSIHDAELWIKYWKTCGFILKSSTVT